MLGTQRIKVIEENVHLPPSTPTLTTPRHCSALFCGPSVKGGKTERFDWEGKGMGGRRGKQAILLGNQTNGGSTQRQPKVGRGGGWRLGGKANHALCGRLARSTERKRLPEGATVAVSSCRLWRSSRERPRLGLSVLAEEADQLFFFSRPLTGRRASVPSGVPVKRTCTDHNN